MAILLLAVPVIVLSSTPSCQVVSQDAHGITLRFDELKRLNPTGSVKGVSAWALLPPGAGGLADVSLHWTLRIRLQEFI